MLCGSAYFAALREPVTSQSRKGAELKASSDISLKLKIKTVTLSSEQSARRVRGYCPLVSNQRSEVYDGALDYNSLSVACHMALLISAQDLFHLIF